MPALTTERIAELLEPFTIGASVPAGLYPSLQTYLDLLIRWNGRTNLTAIREPEQIVTRHFGESLFAGWELQKHLPDAKTLLDFGSGAGFPGLPIQIAVPHLAVTLGESQGKKAAFLREAIRVLKLPTALWPRRVEEMAPTRQFDIVALRAVDKMDDALAAARIRLVTGGHLLVLGGEAMASAFPGATVTAIPEATHRKLIFVRSES